jgi:hypothetical protein
MVTQNVTQNMGKPRKYCLIRISAGKKRAAGRRAFLACQTTEGDGVAGARTWMPDQFDAERSRWMLLLPVAMGLGIAVYFELPSDSHRCGRPPVVTWILRMIRSALVSASLVFGGLLRRFGAVLFGIFAVRGSAEWAPHVDVSLSHSRKSHFSV